MPNPLLLPFAIYLLSFWHYALYWRTFAYGTADFDGFKRKAIVLKIISVTVLALVYLRFPLDPLSLAVIAGGIFLNARAAAALGLDRTYYGHEVAGLPPRRITAFPYSLTAHPMILAQCRCLRRHAAQCRFRDQWWPLAGHVAANVGLWSWSGPAPAQSSRPKENP